MRRPVEILTTLALVACALTARPSAAQDLDTTAVATIDTLAVDTLAVDTLAVDTVAADTLDSPLTAVELHRQARRAPPDSVIGFFRDGRGSAVGRREPARVPVLHPVEYVHDLAGAFSWAFRSSGWPDAWSRYGLDPADTRIERDGRVYENLTVGRSALEMVPIGFMESVRLDGAATLVMNTSTFDIARPITGIRYQTDNLSLQHVEAFHAQRRLLTFFGRTGVLNLTGGYMGRGASGEYPGSRLQRERGLYGRVRFARPTWSVQIANLYGRHEVGAHAGVQPFLGAPYETIYSRLDPAVRNEGADRTTIRNDFDVTLRLHKLQQPTTVIVYHTAESFRYDYLNEYAGARINRFGVAGSQPFTAGGHRLDARLDAWIENVEDDFALQGLRQRYAITSSVQDSLGVGIATLVLNAGFRMDETRLLPTGAMNISVGTWPLRFFAEALADAAPVSRIATQGFGRYVVPSPDAITRQILLGRAGVDAARGAWSASLEAFVAREQDGVAFTARPTRDTIVVHPFLHAVDRAGIAAGAGFRADARRGIYAEASATALTWLRDIELPGAVPLSETQPALWLNARLGARALLFQGDLDADLYVRGHTWTAMKGRVLHPQTGLLVIPDAGAHHFGGSGWLDVVLEGDVRTATLFVAYENVLSGTQITLGNLLVPDYPLPERRLRFGVFWPIFD